MTTRNWANALFLWLSLATVLVPALGSSGSPLRLTEGSAFSAFTSDVSLGPSRTAAIEEEGSAQTAPGDGGSAVRARARRAAPIAGPALALAAPGSVFDTPSPRAARFAGGAIGARAPPRA